MYILMAYIPFCRTNIRKFSVLLFFIIIIIIIFFFIKVLFSLISWMFSFVMPPPYILSNPELKTFFFPVIELLT